MSNETRVQNSGPVLNAPISLVDRLQSSEQFDSLFKEGMALVERTATYLDGQGRRDAKGLASGVTVLYATESMRLTTRLLDLASWLLIRRALKQGEITEIEARMKRQSVKLQALGRPSHIKGYEDLPTQFRALVEQSFVLLDKITHLDRALSPGVAQPVIAVGENPVSAQILRLNRAFGRN
jgi:regulator of CtrA degradation